MNSKTRRRTKIKVTTDKADRLKDITVVRGRLHWKIMRYEEGINGRGRPKFSWLDGVEEASGSKDV